MILELELLFLMATLWSNIVGLENVWENYEVHAARQRASRCGGFIGSKSCKRADSALRRSHAGLVTLLVVSGKTRLSLNPEMNPVALIWRLDSARPLILPASNFATLALALLSPPHTALRF